MQQRQTVRKYNELSRGKVNLATRPKFDFRLGQDWGYSEFKTARIFDDSLSVLDAQRKQTRRTLFVAQDEFDRQRDKLIAQSEEKMKRRILLKILSGVRSVTMSDQGANKRGLL